MSPYADMLRSMKPQHMRIVVTFLQEAMKEAEAEKTAAEDVTHLSLVITPTSIP